MMYHHRSGIGGKIKVAENFKFNEDLHLKGSGYMHV